MQCARCNAPLAEGAQVCDRCGERVAAADGQAGGGMYEENGRWYSRTADGQLWRWDSVGERWEAMGSPGVTAPAVGAAAAGGGYVAPASSTPAVSGTRPRFTSLRTPATWLYVLFAIFIAATAFAVYADWDQVSVLRDIENGEPVTIAEANESDDLFVMATGLQTLALLLVAGFFVWWTRRATANVRALGATNPSFSPAWAIAWWFIPIANWFQPFRVIRQAWRASDTSSPVRPNEEWKQRPVAGLLWVWWLFWAISNALLGVGLNLRETEDITPGEAANFTTMVLVADMGLIVAAVLAAMVVRQLTQRQDERNAQFVAAGM